MCRRVRTKERIKQTIMVSEMTRHFTGTVQNWRQGMCVFSRARKTGKVMYARSGDVLRQTVPATGNARSPTVERRTANKDEQHNESNQSCTSGLQFQLIRNLHYTPCSKTLPPNNSVLFSILRSVWTGDVIVPFTASVRALSEHFQQRLLSSVWD